VFIPYCKLERGKALVLQMSSATCMTKQ